MAPEITNVNPINVAENTEKGSSVYTCNVKDQTVYGGLTYSAVFDPPNNALVFDSTNCGIKISDNEKLDFEKQSSYNVTITVSDGFKEENYQLKINVIDENDPPEFTVTSYPVEVTEGGTGSIKVTPNYQVRDPEGNAVSYEIVNNGTVLFQITNSSKGEITNVAEIDFENLDRNPIKVTVKVRDDTSGDSEATVFITIKDANDNEPEFTNSLYEFNISLSTPASTKLTRVEATDKDSTTNAEITYRLKETSPFFEVLSSGDVVLKSKITVPYGTLLTAEIEAVDGGNLTGTTTISGVWNKPPEILQLPEYKTIAEDQTDAIDLFVFSTSDPENDPVNCVVKSINSTAKTSTDGAFIVVKNTGTEEFTIRFSGSYTFNEAEAPYFDVNIECSDGNGGTVTGFLNVRVTPNQLPVATCNPTDSKTVSALNNAINTVVYDIEVTDQENDPLIINFTSVPKTDFYGFDAATKTIQVRKDLRIETQSTYTWYLEIDDQKHNDGAGNKVTVPCTIYVTVIDLNEKPRFDKGNQTISLPEDTATGSVLHTFNVIDADNTTIACDVNPISEANMFEIDPKLKTIKLVDGKEFDYEGTHQSYEFVCTATDSYQSATATLSMMITDTNDRPIFSKTSYSATVDEGQPGEVIINAKFNFTDEEMTAGQTYYYALETSADSEFFEINPNTGVITNVKEIDVDAGGAATTMQLTVKVIDSEGGEGTTTLDINLRDINDKTPVFNPNIYNYILAESLEVGNVFGTVAATDEDKDEINNKIVYSLDQPNEFFDVTPDGKFTLIKSLAGQYAATYTIKVKATDTGVKPGPKNTTAPVVFKWNEKPKITNLDQAISIKEDRTGPMTIPNSKIETTDKENNKVECSIITITPNTDVFTVVDNEVYYNFKRPLVYRSVSSYTAQVECVDTVGGGRDVKSLQIDIEKNKDPKPDCLPSVSKTINIASNSFNNQGADVHTITTNDEENDAITYSITNGAPAGALQAFQIGRFDGKITTSRDLRYVDREPVRELIVAVRDAKDNVVTCTVIITMDNLNEPPKFESLPTTIDVDESLEPEAADRELYTVTITDNVKCIDPIGISWDVEPVADKDLFTITQNGLDVKISVAKGQELNHEKESATNQYKFTIRAQDGCLPESRGVVTVNVKDLNEPPVFLKGDKYYANVSQVEKGIIDLGCQGYDPDDKDELTLELTGDEAKYFKIIDHAKCHIQLVGEYPLDKPDSAKNKFDLKMTLKDKAGEEATADLTMEIWDYNNHAPEFQETAYQGTDIFPGDAVGKELGKVEAEDLDISEKTNGAVEYYLKGCNNGGEQFVSVLGDGTVKLKQSPASVGMATGTIFNCKIEARDKGVYPGILSGTALFDVLYTEPPPTPPPVTVDPNADDDNDNNNDNNNNNNNNNNGNANANGNGNGNANGNNNTTTVVNDNFINSPAAIALLSVLGALLLGLLIFGICRCCCGNCGGGGTGCMNGGNTSTGNYYTNSRVATPSQIHVNEGKYNSVRPTPVVHP